jgi:hypothetical protein
VLYTYPTNKGKTKRGATGKARQNKTSGRSARAAARDVLRPRDREIPRFPELKHLDVNTSGYIGGTTYAGTLTDLTAVTQGAAGNQRTGDSIRIRGITFRASAYHQAGSVQGILRFIVFSFNEDNAASVAGVLQSSGSSLAVVSPYNSDHVENGALNIIFDKSYAGDSSPDAFFMEFTKELDLSVHYTAGATTGSGKIWCLVISDAGLATNCANYQWWSRIIFDDD